MILPHIYLSSGKGLSESEMGHLPTFEILVHLTWNDPELNPGSFDRVKLLWTIKNGAQK